MSGCVVPKNRGRGGHVFDRSKCFYKPAVVHHDQIYFEKNVCHFSHSSVLQLVHVFLLFIGWYDQFRPAVHYCTRSNSGTSKPYSSSWIYSAATDCPSTLVVYSSDSFGSRCCYADTTNDTLPSSALPISSRSASTCW